MATLTRGPSVMVLSRPFSKLSPIGTVLLGSIIGRRVGSNGVILFSDRRVGCVRRFYSDVTVLGGNGVTLYNSLGSVGQGCEHSDVIMHDRRTRGVGTSDNFSYSILRGNSLVIGLPSTRGGRRMVGRLTRDCSVSRLHICRPSLGSVFIRCTNSATGRSWTVGRFNGVLGFRFGNCLGGGVFINIAIFLILLVTMVVFFPHVTSVFRDRGSSSGSGNLPVVLVGTRDRTRTRLAHGAFTRGFVGCAIGVAGSDVRRVGTGVASNRTRYTFIVGNTATCACCIGGLSLCSAGATVTGRTLARLCRVGTVVSDNVSLRRTDTLVNVHTCDAARGLNISRSRGFFCACVVVFTLCVIVLLCKRVITAGITARGDSHTVRLLIADTGPASVVFNGMVTSYVTKLVRLVTIFNSSLLFCGLGHDC